MVQQVVLVTGCTRGGIGYYISKSFAKRGYKVYATARRIDSMEGLEECEKLVLDVLQTEQINAVVKEIIDKEGRIDVLFNNAGSPMVAPLADLPRENASRCLDINVLGPLMLARAVAPHMAKQGSGKIVNVGSVAGYNGLPFAGMYAASKAALHAMSDVLRMELAPFGIYVTVVAPGAIRSNIGANSEQSMVLPSTSLYQSAAEYVRRRAVFSQGSSSTPTDVFAEIVVNKVVRRRPPRYITAGTGAWIALILYYVPCFIKDFLLSKKFGLDHVKAIKSE
ncbi:NAD(P)-binding protein [Hesseltinella vesiculosa]|uniref:NAD(P)-binding protein n=1 Tax=Hesseltinella vesiculosa TaxID=101127 RepID=A0A1X2GV67_9FUNG|nr:NAD(P)-binding protein [Hesseltinella vesiculosa]